MCRKRQLDDFRRACLAAHHQIDFGTRGGKFNCDISHRNRAIHGRAETTAGDFANFFAVTVQDRGMFTRRGLAFGFDPDTLAIRAIGKLIKDDV